MATIKDVSKKANVSIATVSHVLNNTKFVSEGVKQKVLEAVRETGYTPNKIAKSLKMNRSKTIGLIVTYIENPIYSKLFRVIEEAAQLQGYTVIVTNSSDDPAMEAMQIELLLSNRIDGLIVVPAKNSTLKESSVIPADFPVVLLNRRLDREQATNIVIENKKAAYEAVKHLIEKHHYRSIAAVIGASSNMLSSEREAGYSEALLDHQLEVRRDWIVEGHSTFQGGFLAAQQLMELPHPPRAIFVSGTNMMLGVLLQLKKMGVKCPDDIALIGFSDSTVNPLMDPPLSSIAQPTSEMGAMAVERMIQKIEGTENEPQTVILPCTMNYRRSCGCQWEPTLEWLNVGSKYFHP